MCKSEWMKINEKYPSVSFNDTPSKRNGNNILVATETYSIHPRNYDHNIIRQYKKYVNWNPKFLKEVSNGVYINGVPLFDNYYNLTDFVSYENKIDGICLMCRYRNVSPNNGDITFMRLDAMQKIDYPNKHCYGSAVYGGEMYRGRIGDSVDQTWPSSVSKLKKLNEYKFSVCFENNYHPMWSYGYVTEKILDCFKAKNAAIYYGCYNIEEYVPKDCFIDFRDFGLDYLKLSKYLKAFTKTQYEYMTNKAFEFVKKTRLGSIPDLEEILRRLL